MKVVRNRDVTNTRNSIIVEIWTAESQEAITELFEQVELSYPKQGYGTFLSGLTMNPDTGVWTARFSRYTSCD